MTKEARLHNVGKTVSSTNGAGKTEQLLKEKKKKKGISVIFNILHKNKFKIN